MQIQAKIQGIIDPCANLQSSFLMKSVLVFSADKQTNTHTIGPPENINSLCALAIPNLSTQSLILVL